MTRRIYGRMILLVLMCGLLGGFCACHDNRHGGQDTSETKSTDMTSPMFDETTLNTCPDTQPQTNTQTEEETTLTEGYVVTDMAGVDGLDFVIDFPAGKDIKILQITDTQMQTMAGVRNENRKNQVGNAFFSALPDDFELRVWRYMDEAVAQSSPDLIVLTGDNIYGELDDSGKMWKSLIRKMDGYGIPWCVVFGNHDNESGKGVNWQVSQLLHSEYCIFRQGAVTGNSNYNLLIRQGGQPYYLLYMMDSNGCQTRPNNPGEGMMPDNVDIDKIQQTAGFGSDQVSWMTRTAKNVKQSYGDVPVLMFFHIPPIEAVQSVYDIYGNLASQFPFEPNREGDLGVAKETLMGVVSGRFWKSAQNMGCVGMFVGHQHEIATSIVCKNGIRLTYGLKTSTYDYHDKDMLGSTLITLGEQDGGFNVTYLYTKLNDRE